MSARWYFGREMDEETAAKLKSNFQSNCAQAAEVLKSSHVLVLVTGAGFSADSGLAVYADVANIPAYKDRGLEYHDICQPHWQASDPELFFGFWGQCFNDYRSTQPHEGYDILARWRNDKNAGQAAADIRKRLAMAPKKERLANKQPYAVDGSAGAFFTFTSNVDAHSFDVFQAHEIHECHGNIELWQCSGKCGQEIWRAPLDHRFVVDPETMLAPEKRSDDPDILDPPQVTEKVVDGTPNTARIGHTLGGSRQNPLKNMPKSDETISFGATDNWPKCKACGGTARPAILMFGDWAWKQDKCQELRWDQWKQVIGDLCGERSDLDPLKVCIVEIGCGLNVPTCRYESESMVADWSHAGGDVHLVRINPDFPLPRQKAIFGNVISIMSRGLEALKEIDRYYRQPGYAI